MLKMPLKLSNTTKVNSASPRECVVNIDVKRNYFSVVPKSSSVISQSCFPASILMPKLEPLTQMVVGLPELT